jgi:transcriptional regulator GlxA family with amidase domain
MTLAVGIYLFDEVEVLDFAGPFEVFSTAARVARRDRPSEAPPFAVTTIAREARAVRARGGLLVLPDQSFATQTARLDALVIPGGVVTAELGRSDVIAWIGDGARRAKLVGSVCTGAFLLAKAGLLDGRKATTHWEDQDDLRRMFPAVTVVPNVRWVDDGGAITSGGISAGIDMSLHAVERLTDRALADATARQMEFDWRGNGAP